MTDGPDPGTPEGDGDPTYDHLSVPAEQVAGLLVPSGLAPLAAPSAAGSHAGPNDAAAIGIRDTGEPLVRVTALPCINSYRAVGWAGTDDVVWLRGSVVALLRRVQDGLPHGFGLAVHDGWRSPATVRALYEHYYGPGSTLQPGFLADPDDEHVTPPHGTGGAVDLTLSWQGVALSLGTAFDDFTDRAHLHALEVEPGPSRDLRRLLVHSMAAAGFAANPVEWWHFSHGDQAWAAATGAGHARFGPTSPPPS
jgi:D-alanyl-D-alanine dipeptidase